MNTEATHEQNVLLSTGQRLRAAREQLGLSQQAIAERLCLKVSTIRQIEDGSLPADLASTFLRGYIRSYARVVHIPEEELLPAITKDEPFRPNKVNTVHGLTLGKPRKKRDGWLWSFTFLVLVVVVGLTGTWWWQNHRAQQEEITSMVDQSSERSNTDGQDNQSIPLDNGAQAQNALTEAAPPAPDAPSDITASADAATSAPQQEVASDQAVANSTTETPAASASSQLPSEAQAPATVAAVPDANAAAASANALAMKFKNDCWLEVTDATGKTLFSGLQRKNGNLNLSGTAPYKLTIGAPSAVEIQFQGKPVDLSRFIRTSQIARFTLNAE